METTTSQGFSVAAATQSDCNECATLLVGQLSEHGIVASTDQVSSVLEKIVADKTRGFLLLARAAGQMVGVAYVVTIQSVEHSGVVAWLEELYVTPLHRLRGIGTALVEAVVEHAREMGVAAIDLEIDSGHSRAESLYRRLGFCRLSRSRWARELKT